MAASKTANVSKFGWPARLSLAIVVASALSAVAHAQTPQSAAEKAAAVFDRHCASCHQSGRTSGRTPDSFANILRLDEVASEENLVLPRRPDASRIYQRMVGAHPPLDTSLRASGTKGPSPEEIEAVRDWIDGIPPRDEACRARTFVTPASILEATQAWLGRLAPADAADTRFVSLIHLHNACASEAQLNSYRDAIGKLVNRLSRRAEFVAVHALGDSNAWDGSPRSGTGLWATRRTKTGARCAPTGSPGARSPRPAPIAASRSQSPSSPRLRVSGRSMLGSIVPRPSPASS
jgi:hypothetical protein